MEAEWRSGVGPVVASSAARRSAIAWAIAVSWDGLEAAEDGPQQVVAEGVALVEHLDAGGGEPDQHDPAVLGHARPLDEPRSSIRSMSPVAFDSETSRTSASRLIGISPSGWSVYMMWSCAMLTPSRSSRSLMAHLICVIVARKSAMMRSVGSAPTVVAWIAPGWASIVRVT